MHSHVTTISTRSGLQFGISIRIRIIESGEGATVTVLPLEKPERLKDVSQWVIHYSEKFMRIHLLNHVLLLSDAHSQIGMFMEGFTDRWAENPRGTFILMREWLIEDDVIR